MHFLTGFINLIALTLERLWQQRTLALWALVGLATATSLALGLWLYVDAVNTNLLTSRLSDPPYAYRFRYLGAWNGNITPADVTSSDAVIRDSFPRTLGLPTARVVRYVKGGAWTVRFDNKNLGAFGLSTLDGAESQMQIVAGQWPPEPSEDDSLPVLIPEKMLYEIGLQVGDTVTAVAAGVKQPLTLKIAALWRPVNEDDPSWIFPPKFFDQVMLLTTDSLATILEGRETPIDECAWYVIFDGESVKTSDIDRILARTVDGVRDVTSVLPGVRLDASPVDGLTAFSVEVNQLTQQLVIMILPVGGLVLYFVTLVAALLVTRQQTEDVLLRSRGMSRFGILSLHFLMWLALLLIALGVALAVGPMIVRLVGMTSSFLRFENTDEVLVAVFTPQAIAAALVTGAIAASSALWMAWRTSGQSITQVKRAGARASTAWWQRMYLDIMLLVPAGYALFTLWQKGGLVASAETPFSDPLTFIGPTLFSLGLTLLFLRLWPFMMRLGAAVLSYGRGVALLMALRELSRSIGRYRGTLLMMCFTLSLIGFTASMASTLDRSLRDSVDYRIGADAVLVVAVDAQTEQDTANQQQGQQAQLTVTGFNMPPIEDLEKVDGIESVSPAGRYPARLVLSGRRVDGNVLGIDRATIASVIRTRPDYADTQMAELFNRLAGNRTGIILSEQAAQDAKLAVGQEVELQISALNEWYEIRVPIVGLVRYFPTLDPREGFFAIMNLDPIFETVGTPLPYDIWMHLKPGADQQQVAQAVRDTGFPVLRWLDPDAEVRRAETAPARRGILGFLSIGFVASVALTLVGAVIQSAASFRAQTVQMGSLRAMGLGGGSVGTYLIFTQGMVATSGVASGTLIGLGTTLLFLPLLDFSGGLPPYLVRVAWGDITLVYSVFAGVLLVVTLLTTILMGRERLSTVVKLGDA